MDLLRLVFVNLLIGLVGLLVGCGSGWSDGKILHVGNGAEPSGFDPNIVTGVPEYRIVNALFEGLVSKDPTTLRPVPAAAERWDINEDGTVYMFHLQQDAQWSDGQPVRAADFVYSYRRMLTPDFGAQFAYFLFDIKNAEAFNKGELADFAKVGVKALGEKRLQVTLENPNPFLLDLISHYAWFPVPEHVVEAHGGMLEINSRWTKPGNMVGNGPFALNRWRINSRTEVLRSASYWDAATVKLDGIHFHAVKAAETEERMFRSGQLHITGGLPLGKIPVYRERDDPALVLHPLVGTYYYRFNTTKPPLDDARVRRALSMAVDRKAIVEKVTRGGETPAFHFAPAAHPDFKPPIVFGYNVEAAQKLLAEAGFPDGKDFPNFAILYNTSEAHREIAETVGDMWKRSLKIEVTFLNMDWKAYLEAIDDKNYDLCRAGWVADLLDPKIFLELWTDGHSMNRTGWHTEAYDALIARSSREPELTARLGILAEAERMLMTEMPVMPLYHYTSKYLKDPKVTGYDANLIEYHPWKGVDIKNDDVTPERQK